MARTNPITWCSTVERAAEAVQKAVADWCGAKLELTDDRGVTGEDAWLQEDVAL